ncbi:MAG: hypothetical protein FRX49_01856 [Trebouxia sp. A1-2]|nr:MAG: hypothetical protein FRX49_01856 [Trebouxia sp. A1-2]
MKVLLTVNTTTRNHEDLPLGLSALMQQQCKVSFGPPRHAAQLGLAGVSQPASWKICDAVLPSQPGTGMPYTSIHTFCVAGTSRRMMSGHRAKAFGGSAYCCDAKALVTTTCYSDLANDLQYEVLGQQVWESVPNMTSPVQATAAMMVLIGADAPPPG